jgi:hypothetical protein
MYEVVTPREEEEEEEEDIYSETSNYGHSN